MGSVKKKSNNNNNCKVAEKTMTRISKVRSIIISISNPSAAITAAFTSQVDVHCVYGYHTRPRIMMYTVRLLTSVERCSTTHDAFIPIR